MSRAVQQPAQPSLPRCQQSAEPDGGSKVIRPAVERMGPSAAPAVWPYPHRTLAQVWADEGVATRRGRRRADPLRTAKMAKLYSEGLSLREIGAEYGLTGERVRQLFAREGCPTDPHRRGPRPAPLSEDEIELVRLYKAGTRPKVLRERFPHLTVNVVLRRSRTDAAPLGSWLTREDDEARTKAVAELYCGGLKTSVIAARLGLHQPGVYRYLRKAGIAPSRRRTAHRTNRSDAA